jgi:DNA-binding MarR family transcriptional regulator
MTTLLLGLVAAERTLRAAHAAALAPHGLTPEEWRALDAVERNSGMAIGELARVAAFNLPALSKLADRMVERGFLRRQRHAEDTRRVLVQVTPAGARVAAVVRPIVEAAEREVGRRLGQWDADRLVRLLKGLA